MISLALHTGNGSSPLSKYQIAGRCLVTDFTTPALLPFAAAGAAHPLSPPLPAADRFAAPTLVYRGKGRFGGGWGQVESRCGPGGYRVILTGVGTFTIQADGSAVTRTETVAGAAAGEVIDAALGPALILALALRGTWCLHASAAANGDHLVAFLGDSGSGKSTLAAFLGTSAGQWRILADDIVPVELTAASVAALPRFPQLGLPADGQPGAGEPERLRLDRLYLLASAPQSGACPAISRLPRREATMALVRHTVASRLFGGDLLARHLRFCSEVSGRLPLGCLRYVRCYDFLDQVRQAIEADLREGP